MDVWSTEALLRDFCGKRYLKNNTDLLVDRLFLRYFHEFSSLSYLNGANLNNKFEQKLNSFLVVEPTFPSVHGIYPTDVLFLLLTCVQYARSGLWLGTHPHNLSSGGMVVLWGRGI